MTMSLARINTFVCLVTYVPKHVYCNTVNIQCNNTASNYVWIKNMQDYRYCWYCFSCYYLIIIIIIIIIITKSEYSKSPQISSTVVTVPIIYCYAIIISIIIIVISEIMAQEKN